MSVTIIHKLFFRWFFYRICNALVDIEHMFDCQVSCLYSVRARWLWERFPSTPDVLSVDSRYRGGWLLSLTQRSSAQPGLFYIPQLWCLCLGQERAPRDSTRKFNSMLLYCSLLAGCLVDFDGNVRFNLFYFKKKSEFN